VTVNGLTYHERCTVLIRNSEIQDSLEEIPGVSDFLSFMKNEPESLLMQYFNGYLSELDLLEKYGFMNLKVIL
jgi:hypothetical protein